MARDRCLSQNVGVVEGEVDVGMGVGMGLSAGCRCRLGQMCICMWTCVSALSVDLPMRRL